MEMTQAYDNSIFFYLLNLFNVFFWEYCSALVCKKVILYNSFVGNYYISNTILIFNYLFILKRRTNKVTVWMLSTKTQQIVCTVLDTLVLEYNCAG